MRSHRPSRPFATPRCGSSGSTTSSSRCYRYGLLTFSRAVGWTDRYLVDGVLNVVSAWTLDGGDAPAADPDRQGAGLRLGCRPRLAGADGVDRSDVVSGVPVLSIITWSPFVAALVIMAFARHRPLLVRLDGGRSAPPVRWRSPLWLCFTYDRAAAGFQFAERLRARARLSASRTTWPSTGWASSSCCSRAIILFAGVFASWTVRTRGQEFYALLLLLVTGVFGVFVSLDLFVFFLFYEIAVLPMYLLIGIWGSTGEVRPQGIFGWAFKRTGVGTKEYAAMKLTLYLLLGSAFILVGILALYTAAGSTSFSFVDLADRCSSRPRLQSWVFLVVLRRLRHARRHLPAPHLVARRPRFRADGRVDAACGRADEARRIRRRAARSRADADGRASSGRGSSARSPASTSSTARSARWRRRT